MGIRGVDRSFRLVGPKRARIESEHYWFEIRVDWSHEISDDCFDVLIGKKEEGRNVHAHLKIARDQSVIFQEPRDFLRTLGRRINSKKSGQLADETKVFDEKKSEGAEISFKFIIDEPTKTIRLDVSESRIREKREKGLFRMSKDESKKDVTTGAGIGLAIGVGLGVIFGTMIDNLALGIAFGAATARD